MTIERLSEREHSTVKTILYDKVNHNAVTAYLYDYPDDKVHLIGEQIDHEQQVIDSALRMNAVDLEFARAPFGLGNMLHFREVAKLKEQRSLLQRRSQELDFLWQQEDERLRKEAGVTWEGLNEVFTDLGYPSLLEFDRNKEHGLYYLVPKSSGVYLELYGNTVLLPSYPETTYLEAITSLGIQDKIRRQLIYPGDNEAPFGMYRLVVPYKNWILATQPVDTRGYSYPDDPDYKPAYWPGLLIPTHEEVVQWVAV